MNFGAFISSGVPKTRQSKTLYSYLQTLELKVDNVAFFFWVFFAKTNTKVEETEIDEKEERNEEKNIKVLSQKK